MPRGTGEFQRWVGADDGRASSWVRIAARPAATVSGRPPMPIRKWAGSRRSDPERPPSRVRPAAVPRRASSPPPRGSWGRRPCRRPGRWYLEIGGGVEERAQRAAVGRQQRRGPLDQASRLRERQDGEALGRQRPVAVDDVTRAADAFGHRGRARTHPQRRLESPYDFVRLLVEMNRSPSVAAGRSAELVASR